MYQRDMQNPEASIEAILPKLVDVYKYGFRENKWQQMFEKLEEDPEAKIKRRVKGQDEAVESWPSPCSSAPSWAFRVPPIHLALSPRASCFEWPDRYR